MIMHAIFFIFFSTCVHAAEQGRPSRQGDSSSRLRTLDGLLGTDTSSPPSTRATSKAIAIPSAPASGGFASPFNAAAIAAQQQPTPGKTPRRDSATAPAAAPTSFIIGDVPVTVPPASQQQVHALAAAVTGISDAQLGNHTTAMAELSTLRIQNETLAAQIATILERLGELATGVATLTDIVRQPREPVRESVIEEPRARQASVTEIRLDEDPDYERVVPDTGHSG